MDKPEIVVGVCGGIAAYKTAFLVSKLAQQGYGVTAVMTRAAHQLIGPATFAALTGRPVATRMFASQAFPLGAHIELAERAKLLVIAPATARFMAQAAQGDATDLLGTLYLCCRAPVLIAPAMNSRMWEQPAVQRNLTQLNADGVHFVDPTSGWLSCRQHGKGRMAEPEAILAHIEKLLPLKS